jgi:hypothetical protein
VEIEVGRGLGRLTRELSTAMLGIPRHQDACTHLYGFTWSLGRALRCLADRLPALPHLHRAFLSGHVPRSKIAVAARVATAETDAAWAQACKGSSLCTLREAAKHVKASGGEPPVGPESVEAPELVRVSWQCSSQDAFLWRYWGRTMLKTVLGQDTSDGVLLETLLQEVESELEPAADDASRSAGPGRTTAAARRSSLLERASRRARRAADRKPPAEALLAKLPRVADAPSVEDLNAALQQLVRLLRRLTWEKSRVLRGLHADDLYTHLGYKTWDAFVEHALGASDRDVHELLTLEGKLSRLPALADAFQHGTLALRTLRMLRLVARPGTDAAWVEHALRATDKRLQHEVPFHQLLRVSRPGSEYLELTRGGLPLPDLTIPEMAARWRNVLAPEADVEPSGQAVAEGARNRQPAVDLAAAVAQVERELAAGRITSPRQRFMTTVVVLAPSDVAEHFRDVLRRVRWNLGGHADDGACVRFMLLRFAAEHASDGVLALVRRYPVFERDQWLCSNPSCTGRGHFEDHHLEYRSRGGSDDLSNRTTTCWWCHHVVLHGGWATLTGQAPGDLTFTVGQGRWRRSHRNGLRVDVPA